MLIMLGQACSSSCHHTVYNDGDDLFYALRYDGSIYALNLRTVSSPAATREIMRRVTNLGSPSIYLVWNHGPVTSCRSRSSSATIAMATITTHSRPKSCKFSRSTVTSRSS
ncbi:hypothetical protein E2562_003687 [Oryza meyeriana var. granulata]|uniref:Uncharacterized protein n=1 Tax=Oryza meyeriana var. granulata TaxID=110450 RepID=A0A6G1C5H9_9ORYZ|nr:hypothetical protein E2562_003687 [Oryza meyeriana var. granulata]